MKQNQNGFGIVGVIIAILATSIIGIAGWYVWQSQDGKEASSAKTDSSQNNDDKLEDEAHVVASGYAVYEDNNLSFAVDYPEDWPMPERVANLEAAIAQNDERIDTYTTGAISVFSAPIQDFRVTAQYKGASLRPVVHNGEIAWRVADPGLSGLAMDAMYTPKQIVDGEGTKVYVFEISHSDTIYKILTFQVGGTFVGIKTPTYNPEDGTVAGQAQFDTYRAEFDGYVDAMAKTVRLL
jgi:hypothetical protein